jgi:hypothetical protein
MLRESLRLAQAPVWGLKALEYRLRIRPANEQITSLQVRDLDAGGTVIRITHAKSLGESEPEPRRTSL